MLDIYKETDLLVKDLKKAGYEKYSESIKEAKLSGSVASEILGLVLKELKRHSHEIRQEDAPFIKRIENIEHQIKKTLKLDQ